MSTEKIPEEIKHIRAMRLYGQPAISKSLENLKVEGYNKALSDIEPYLTARFQAKDKEVKLLGNIIIEDTAQIGQLQAENKKLKTLLKKAVTTDDVIFMSKERVEQVWKEFKQKHNI